MPGKSPALLIAIGDESLRAEAREQLSLDGYRIEEAGDADVALELARRRPSLVLVDVALPVLPASELCLALRALEPCAETPILVLASADDGDAIQCSFEAGATDFVTKPVQWLILRQRIRYLLRGSQQLGELRRAEHRLESAQELAHLGSWEYDPDGDEFRFSDEALRIFGFDPAGLPPTAEPVFLRLDPEDREAFDWQRKEALETGEPFQMQHRVLLPDGSIRIVEVRGQVILDEEGEPALLEGTLLDVTAQRQADDRIRFLAHHDALTGLANRKLLCELVARAVPQAHRTGKHCAVLQVGLDEFHRVNDALGLSAGDEILRTIAQRLAAAVRLGDWISEGSDDLSHEIGRISGDEFTVLVNGLATPHSAAHLATRLLDAIRRPLRAESRDLVITGSVGIAVSPGDGEGVNELLQKAADAMKHAKARGRNRYQFWSGSQNEEALSTLLRETKLRGAIQRSELLLYYQPKVEPRSGRIVGFEALMRWNDPAIGIVSPAEFIPLAESSGLIREMGAWALREACEQVRRWLDAGLDPGRVSVNVSPVQFRNSDLVLAVREALYHTGVPPGRLEIEITESCLVDNASAMASRLASLRDEGCTVAIDDFGTGFSSLQYLRRLPIDCLKIDRVFVRDVESDSVARDFVAAIILLAKSLNLRTVAEGVETEGQRALLAERGCDYIQGFLYGRPVPAAECEQLLVDHFPPLEQGATSL